MTGLTAEWVRQTGCEAGFDKVGIAPADVPETLPHLAEWLDRGFAGEMAYLANPKRHDIREVMPEARSVICCALGFDTGLPRSTGTPLAPERGWVSRYAWGDDYHGVIKTKLEFFRDAIAEKAGPDFEARLYVDTGPVVERAYAEQAGLGWQGKNTCLIDEALGSFFFLGLLVTNLELMPDTPPADLCGVCTLCIDACPTDAIVEPYVLDARRCISYLTIELRDAIPVDLRQPMGRHVFGCDICQDVCPWNDKSPRPNLPEFRPRDLSPNLDTSPEATHDTKTVSLYHPLLHSLAEIAEKDFSTIFRRSPLKRAKWRGLMRNILVAMGNSGRPEFRPIIEGFAQSGDELLAEHASWAMERTKQTKQTMQRK